MKRLVALIAAVLLTTSAHALDTPLFAGGTGVPSTTLTQYGFVQGANFAWGTSEVTQRNVIPIAGTFKKFSVRLDTAPGVGKSYAFTITKAGVAQTLTCTISDANQTCSDITNTFTVVAGDSVSLKSVPTGTPTVSTSLQVGLVFSAATSISPVIGSTRTTNMGTASVEYMLLQGTGLVGATLNTRDEVIPTGGTFSKLYVELSGTPGSGKSYTFAVLKNGATSGVTCTVSDLNTSCNDTTNSFTVVADDTVVLRQTPTGTPTARSARWGLQWVPDIAGETLVLNGNGSTLNTTGATRYLFPGGTSLLWAATESFNYALVTQAFTWKKLRVVLNTAPGGAASYTFRSRVGAAFGTQTATITGAATTSDDSTNTDSLVSGSLWTVYVVNANTPAASVAKFSSVLVDPNEAPAAVTLRLLTSTGVGR